MKKLILVLLFAGCTTAQLDQTRDISEPVISAALSGYASAFGVPPVLTAGVAKFLQDQFWGMLVHAYAKQPIAQGSSVPKIGAAVTRADAKIPVPTTEVLEAAIDKLNPGNP